MSTPRRLLNDRGHPIGISLHCPPSSRDEVEQALAALPTLGIERLRLFIPWRDLNRPGATAWYGWLLVHAARCAEVLPSISLRVGSSPGESAALVREVLSQLPREIGWFELWCTEQGFPACGPAAFAETAAAIGTLAGQFDRRWVLGGVDDRADEWLDAMQRLSAPPDAIGLGGFGAIDWEQRLTETATRLPDHAPELWITEAGHSTWNHDQRGQLTAFSELAAAPVTRSYWHTLNDALPPTRAAADPEHSHCGLRYHDGSPKLLFRLLAERGVAGIRDFLSRSRPGPEPAEHSRTLITGGAGFIGANLADRLASEGRPVTVVDTLARPGTEQNLEWLQGRHGKAVRFRLADLRDREALVAALRGTEQVYHFAAQVAVTTSLLDPLTDHGINIAGTLTLLEALREMDAPPPLLFTSTNKVYGDLEDVALASETEGYRPLAREPAEHGIDEQRPLAFCSPYGCSKGAADQYVLDYANTFGLPATVLRMSCIYGPRQFGNEDQGWVAHFLIQALHGRPITIFGDGRQVRDILYVDDLVDALLLGRDRIRRITGQAFNIGGGPGNSLSLLELLDRIGPLAGRPEVRFKPWRASDQRWYVSDTRRFTEQTGWRPRTGLDEGIARLHRWLREQNGLPARVQHEGSVVV